MKGLLEAKNSSDRSFIVSAGEWTRAEEQRDRYAFLIVLWSAGGGPPVGMQLLPDPAGLLVAQECAHWVNHCTVRRGAISGTASPAARDDRSQGRNGLLPAVLVALGEERSRRTIRG